MKGGRFHGTSIKEWRGYPEVYCFKTHAVSEKESQKICCFDISYNSIEHAPPHHPTAAPQTDHGRGTLVSYLEP